MKNIFTAVIMAVAVIFTTPVLAQDIYVGSEDGINFYVNTDTVRLMTSEDFFVDVKEYNRDKSLKTVNEWRFYLTSGGNWYFDYYPWGANMPISNSNIAMEILGKCQIYDSRISQKFSY